MTLPGLFLSTISTKSPTFREDLSIILLKETTDYTYTSTTVSLVAGASVGDIVEVQVKSVDYYRQQIDLVAVSGGSTAFDDEEFSSNPYRF